MYYINRRCIKEDMDMIGKRFTAAVILCVVLCGASVSCGSSSSGSSSSEVPTAASEDNIEEAVGAESGDAFLYINEEQGWIQYAGKKDDPLHTMLAYDAGVPHITGNGSYTVSVTADTDGFRFDTTGDVNDDSIKPSGLMFAAVVIFQTVTLPVEFDASNRAIKTLANDGILEPSEVPHASKVLKAAALTYVAGLVASILQLIRLLLSVRRR